VLNPGPGYATFTHLSGDCCINQSIFERPPCSPYGPFTLNSFTFHVSKVKPTCCENISKIQGRRIRCAPFKQHDSEQNDGKSSLEISATQCSIDHAKLASELVIRFKYCVVFLKTFAIKAVDVYLA
jgi:hypothetical protein